MSDRAGPTRRGRALADGAPDAPWVTERVAVELEHTRARTTAVLHMAPDAVLGLDPAGHVTLVNEAATRMFRSEVRGLLGHTMCELLDGPWSDQIARAQRAGGGARVVVEGVEVTARRSDGTTVPVEVSLARTPIDAHLVSTAFLRDVSERVAARQHMSALVEQLRRATAEAEGASRAKTEFLSRMSHELRTPLNAILGFAQLLEMEATDDLDREAIDHITAAGRHLVGLVGDVLDISRIEAGGARFAPAHVDPGASVAAAVEMLTAEIAERDVEVEVTHPTGTATVVADERRLVQIVVNLVSNAVKHGGGRVVVAGEAIADGWQISVTDQGPGICAADLERAFEPFERLGAEDRGVEGSGVGLALSRQLASALGGQLRLRSRLGQGTRAELDLPVAT